jgi:hypothetical protein
MKIFVIRDPLQNSGNRIKFMDKKEFVSSVKTLIRESSSLNSFTFAYIDDEEGLDIVKLDNDTMRVILDE